MTGDWIVLGLGPALARARHDVRSLGRRVVIADETGAYPALGLADALAAAGAEVHFVSASGSIGNPQLASELELQHLLPRLRRSGVTLTVLHDIDRIEGSRVVVNDSLGGEGWELDDVDTVVLAQRRVPRVASLPRAGVEGAARPPRRRCALAAHHRGRDPRGRAARAQPLTLRVSP